MIIGVLIHTAGMAAVMIFIVYYVLKGRKGRNRLFSSVGVIVLAIVAYAYGRVYIQVAIEKGADYLSYSQASIGIFFIYGSSF